MPSYVVSYELLDPTEGRETALLAALEVFEDRIQALASVWFVCSPFGKGWSGFVREDVRAWLERHLGPSC